MALPPSFAQFIGNRTTVEHLRAAVAAGRMPHALLLGGPSGAGKYTLSLLLTMALQCDRQPREPAADRRPLAGFCNVCRHCTRIAEAAALQARIDDAVAAREEMRDTDKKETRILVQTHPDVLVIPPDPPQLLIKLGQIRSVIARAQYVPAEAGARVFIFTSSAFMKEAANSLLKLLEEPPERVHLILLTENPSELLPTVRSRCSTTRLGALPPEEIALLLAERRPELRPAERELVARLSEGAAGRALGFDLAGYLAARNDAFTLLRTAEGAGDHATLFRMTETYRSGAEGQEKTTALVRCLSGLLEDILLCSHGAPDRVRNLDCRGELERLAELLDFSALEDAVRELDAVTAGMRRNLLRSLSLDAFAAGLGSSDRRA